MWTLTRNKVRFGYCTTNKAAILKYRGWYIEDHVQAEAAQIQLRAWTEAKKTILASDAEEIARDTLEEQIAVMEF